MLKPLELVLQQHDDGSYVAIYYDANVNASGDNEQDAVANFKDVLISLYEGLRRQPKKKLGRGPARQLSVLTKVLRRKR